MPIHNETTLSSYPFGPYLASFEVDPEFCKKLLKEGRKLKTPWNKHLVGRINYERLYDHNDESLVRGFAPYINGWMEGWKKFSEAPAYDKNLQGWKFTQLWINIQKAGEYNPIHTHTNCDLSMVLFLKVPKGMNQEKNIRNGAPNGSLSFIHGQESDLFITDRVFAPEEGKLFIFPGRLRHHATAFESKGERISVAGNVAWVPKRWEDRR